MQFGMPTLIENRTLKENAILCRELGLRFIELNMNFPEYRMDCLEQVSELLGIAEQYRLYYTIHLDENLNIADLARLFNVSASWLAHEFTRFTHRSVYNYILYRRVTLARQQMLGNASLNNIAYQCGFSDYSNFLRTFTKMAGMSPSDYRRELNRYHNREL